MDKELDGLDWNWAQLILNRALVGQITQNFRRVSLRFENKTWILTITLYEKISDAEYEYIRDEILFEFSEPFFDLEDTISRTAFAAEQRLELRYSQEKELESCLPSESIAFEWRQPESGF